MSDAWTSSDTDTLNALLDAQTAAQPINWDGTGWNTVSAFVNAPTPPAAGFDWSKFWNDVLWFGEPPNKLVNDVGNSVTSGVRAVGSGVKAVGNSVLTTVTAAEQQAAASTADAAGTVAKSILPYVIVTGGILAGLMILNKSR